ncbi:DNA-processing protein DprA [Mahella sp.]|uniref:DNA-processing protein DprA n=1 Tax=Mahella sp. TaxID=2798721 RepID=UPI0025C09B98|nr:DNA-processing protein DprA [Mahella sp.]MBZ4666777.1 protecting protein DprA [Mahella sp.]
MTSEELHWIWLSSITGIGPNRFYALIEALGSASDVWAALSSPYNPDVEGMGTQLWNILRQYRDEKYVEKLVADIEKNGIDVLISTSPDYPKNLKETYNPPPTLYVKGKIDNVKDEMAVAVVGTRRCSAYGRTVTDKLCSQAAAAGITIVSGMARGIDGLAHKAAIDAGGRTLAVLGCGVDMIYPPEHKPLYYDIISHGAVISEFPPGMEPLRGNFPQRNRIISGLSLATLVIEAGNTSGALITADFALEQGRDVMAVPGNITSPNSIGTNRLIKQGAKPITDVQDILEEFGVKFNANIAAGDIAVNQLNIEEQRLLKFFQDSQPVSAEKLCVLSKMSAAEVNGVLTSLEIKGIIKQLPGTLFIKNA